MRKSILFVLSLFVFNTFLYSQNDNISLPDVTTVVSGQNKNSDVPGPDISDSVSMPAKSLDLLIELPEEYDDLADVPVRDVNSTSSILVDGAIGGGFPSAYLGEFKVRSLESENPFRLTFNHNSASGFAGKDLITGFNQRSTSINLSKSFISDAGLFLCFLNLQEDSNGLQNQIQNISAENQDFLGANLMYRYNNVVKKMSLSAGLSTNFYYRYADVDADGFSSKDWFTYSSLFDCTPSISAKYVFKKGEITTGARYSLYIDGKRNLSDLTVNRTNLFLNTKLNLNGTILNANAGVILGDHLNGNDFLLPFDIGIANKSLFNGPVGFEIHGGLKSEFNSISKLEKNYLYSAASSLCSESANWFGSLDFSVKVKDSFDFDIYSEYKKTAYGCGTWEPVYEDSNFICGMYSFEQKDMTILSSLLSLNYVLNPEDSDFILKSSIGYKINWLDIPVLESNQSYTASVNYSKKNNKWGIGATVTGNFDSNDFVPDLGLTGFIELTKSVQLSGEVKDLFKLTTLDVRTYKGKYVSRGGCAILMLKFLYN